MPATLLLKSCPFLLFLLLASACSTPVKAPVDSRAKTPPARHTPGYSKSGESPQAQGSSSDYHVVRKGDTLYSIAWRYGLDYRDIAGWNDIRGKYVIYPGQFIRLKPDPSRPRPLVPGPVVKKKPADSAGAKPQAKPNVQAEKQTQKKSPSKAASGRLISWQWPTSGKIVKLNTPTSKKGVDISGRAGQEIKAAADGDVVYSGSGLLGYGKLIIIKHNDRYLSAYAHNEKLYAKEGDKVRAGQQIATMGLGNKGRPILHFEIRKDGTPVNPLKHLPRDG